MTSIRALCSGYGGPAQLSVIGKGVVPQAAVVALADLLQPSELAA